MNARRSIARAVTGIDSRALAVFRVGLGFAVLFDVLQRAGSLRAHYTDAGVLSRADALLQFPALHEWGLCVHLLGGSTLAQGLLFALHALAAIALLIGYRSTAATFVAWLLTASIQLRNPYLGGGFDALLRMFLLWAIFLPLGRRGSVDGRRRAGAMPGEPHVSIGSVALKLPVDLVYLAAGIAKGAPEVWRSGDALALVLHDEFFANSFGLWLGEWTTLCRGLTWIVLVAEVLGPPLLFALAPLPWFATALVAMMVAMNVGFAATLGVGSFPWLISLGLVVFVPTPIWSHLQSRGTGFVAALRERWQSATAALAERLPGATAPARPSSIGRRGADVVCAVLLVYVLAWNIAIARSPAGDAPESLRWFGNTLSLQQSWRMFASPSTLTGWALVRGQLVDGAEVDLLAHGGPVPGDAAIRPVSTARPASIVGSLADIRWRVLLRRILANEDGGKTALGYGRYLCREWNAAHAEGRQLATFEVVRVVKTLARPYDRAEYRQEVIWRHDCFG